MKALMSVSWLVEIEDENDLSPFVAGVQEAFAAALPSRPSANSPWEDVVRDFEFYGLTVSIQQDLPYAESNA